MQLADLETTIRDSIATKERFLAAGLDRLRAVLESARACLESGGKILLCGNGGSSCDAAHAAGELVGWFETKQRRPLPAIALGQETPALTAIANDVGYHEVFARQLEAIGRRGDLLIGISTSGSSKNVLAALERGRALGIRTVALTGEAQGPCAQAADLWLPVPSRSTPRIQECHLLVVHLLCAYLETTCA